MTKVNLKDNIFIEGFDDINKFLSKENKYNVQNTLHFLKRFLIYSGKTSEIPEDLAKKCVHFYFPFDHDYTKLFKDYLLEDESINNFNTAKESIQSACDKEYCIIYKTK